MLDQLRSYLSTLDWHEGQPPPVIDFALYFDGNNQEDSIAPNQCGDGRPSIAEMYLRFQDISRRPEVERVLVGLHDDWNHEVFAQEFPPAESIHIYTTASEADVELWIAGLHADGAGEGWLYGEPANAPKPSSGYLVYSVSWD